MTQPWSALVRASSLIAVVASLLALAGPASALKGSSVFGDTGTEGGQFDVPRDIVVYVGTDGLASTDKVFVVDEQNRRIQRFSTSGVFERAWGEDVVIGGGTGFEICVVAADCKQGAIGTAGGSFDKPTGIAVNQSTGEVFLRDALNERVQVFDLDGTFLRAWGWDVVKTGGAGDTPGGTFEICTVAAECQTGTSGTGDGQFTTPRGFASSDSNAGGIAVDPVSGDVFAVDPGRGTPSGAFNVNRVQRFETDGTFLAKFGSSAQFGPNTPAHIGVDANGIVYAASVDAVQRYDVDASSFLSGIPASFTDALEVQYVGAQRLFRVSAKPADGILEYDLTAEPPTLVRTHVEGWDIDTNGLGVMPDGSVMYASTTANQIVILDEVGAPDATPVMEPVPDADTTAHEAALKGSVDPNGEGIPVSYRFEISADGTTWTPVSEDVDIGDGTDPIPVTDTVTGLEANRLYHVRLVATKAFGNDPVASAGTTLMTDTVAPDVITGGAQNVTAGSAQVRGRINANNLPTTYYVEYGTSVAYGSKEPAGDPADAGSSGQSQLFVRRLTGLEPGTTYHYRFVATNDEGTTFGADETFLTRQAGTVGDKRVYEMVTPPYKASRLGQQRDIAGEFPSIGVPAEDGDSFQFILEFVSLGSGTGTALPHAYDVTRFTRQSDGWKGTALNNINPQEPSIAGLMGPAGLSSDLITQAWQHQELLFPSGSTLGTRIFGDTGGEQGSGWYDWLAGLPNAKAVGPSSADYALVTDGGTHMARWGGLLATYRGLLGATDPSRPGYPNEEQLVTVDATDGTFRLVFDGQATASIARGATAGEVQGKLVGLSNIGPSDVAVTGEDGGPWTVTFAGTLARTDHPPLGTSASGLTGGGKSVTVTTVYDGVPSAPAEALTQVDGDAVYRQVPAAIGPRELVSACTGTGGDATEIPAIAGGLVSAQGCPAGSVTSRHGAALGGGLASNAVGGPVRTAMSANGRRLFFASPDPVLGTPAECTGTGVTTDCPPQLYVRQYDSNGDATVRWISRSQIAGQVKELMGRGVAFEGASQDGSVVYFRTNAPLTADDPNGTGTPGPKTTGTASDASWDLYRYDLPSSFDADPSGGSLTRVSAGPGGSSDPGVFDTSTLNINVGGSSMPFLSEDGQRAYFLTRDVIGDAGDPWNAPPEGTAASSGPVDDGSPSTTRNLYFYDAAKPLSERWKFVARLPFAKNTDIRRIDACATYAAASGMPANRPQDRSGEACVHGTPSGDVIAFETTGQITKDDDDSAGDIYLYEAELDRMTRIAAPSDGTPGHLCSDYAERCNATMGGSHVTLPLERIGLRGGLERNFGVDPDGVSFFFETRHALVAEDAGSTMDVYEWRNGELSLISPTSDHPAYFSGASTDGSDVFFATAERIDPREIDDDFDIYDARVGGGIPLPTKGTPCDALADGCQGAGGGTPIDTPRSSDGPGGGGNATSPPRFGVSVARPSAKALRRVRRSGVLTLRVRAGAAGLVRVTAKRRVRGKLRPAGATSKRAAKAGRLQVRLRIRRPVLRQLRAGRSVRLRVTVAMPGARARTVTLRLPGRPR